MTRLITIAIGSILFLAACAAAPQTPTPATATATPVAPPPAATDAGEPADGDEPHQVPELEAMLPSEVLGKAVNKSSVSGEEAIGELGVDIDIQDAITAAGGSMSDVHIAVGSPDDISFVVVAMRVPGLDARALQTAILETEEAGVPAEEGQIAGKQVTRLGDDQWYYASGDVLFFIAGGVNEANEVISQLP